MHRVIAVVAVATVAGSCRSRRCDGGLTQPPPAIGVRRCDQLARTVAAQRRKPIGHRHAKGRGRPLVDQRRAQVGHDARECRRVLDRSGVGDGVEAEVLYCDPPYPGVLSYEDSYRGVNRLLEPEWDEPASTW